MAGTVAPQRRSAMTPWFRRGPLAPLGEEMESLFDRFLGDESSWVSAMLAPAMDLSETDKDISIRMDLPGVNAKDVDIQLNNQQLTVSGERKEEKEEKGKTFHRMERRVGRFSRSVTLPCAVEEDQIDARYKDGVLNIVLPKTFEAKTRHIEIKS